MELKSVKIHNYKSLRNIQFTPTPLTAIVGPNAAGKSNFADALHFLSEVYSHGLELAIARKGGFENIAFRKKRRTKSTIDFSIVVELETRRLAPSSLRGRLGDYIVQMRHEFSFGTHGTGIRAEFSVDSEKLAILTRPRTEGVSRFKNTATLESVKGKLPSVRVRDENEVAQEVKRYQSRQRDLFDPEPRPQELFVNSIAFRNRLTVAFARELSNLDVFRVTPAASRLSGVPTPNPRLDTTGANLPALVDWLQRRRPEAWRAVLDGMCDVLPGLVDISVQYLHTKTLGLFFEEDQAGRAWGAEDVSDGTIQTLALLAAAADPRTAMFVVEEPENSVHPWIVRVLLTRFRELSKRRAVIVTTHSPILVDMLEPAELWIASRNDGETSLNRLVDLDPGVEKSWKKGEYQLSDFLDAGFVGLAVPGGQP